MPDLEQYNQWKRDNPELNIIDFCGDVCNLEKITKILTFNKIISADRLSSEIETTIKKAIIPLT